MIINYTTKFTAISFFQFQRSVLVLYAQGVSVQRVYALGGKCPGGKCPGGICTRGYVLGGKCPGGKCPGGKCPGGICPWGKCPGGTCPGGGYVLEPPQKPVSGI